MAFDGIQITNRGRNLLAKAEAGQTKITYTKFSVGDGKLAGQMPIVLKALINEKISFPVSRLKIQSENIVVPGFEFSNQGVSSGFFFREVGLWATDPDLGEILYAYANSGEGAEYIDAQNTSAVLKKLFNFELTVSNTAQVTVVVDDTIIYATPQDVADALKKSKEYTDEQILNVQVPDASTTQKGKVQLTNSINSTSEVLAPTAKALKEAYDLAALGYRARGNVPLDWNTATLSGAYNVALSSWTGYSHYPAGAYTYGKLVVFYDSGAFVQIYFTHDNPGRIYTRVSFTGLDWRSWTEVITSNGGSISGRLNVKNSSNTTQQEPTGNWASKILNFADNSTEHGLAVGNRYGSPASTAFLVGGTGGSSGFTEFLKVDGIGNVTFLDADGSMSSLRDLKQSVVNGKGAVAGAINGKGGSANGSNTFAELAAAITNLPVKRFASGTFNGQNASATSQVNSIDMNVAVGGLGFNPARIFIRVRLSDTTGSNQIDALITVSSQGNLAAAGWRNNRITLGFFTPVAGGFSVTLTGSRIDEYAGGTYISKIWAYEWWAYE
ncbi:tail fiber protein [Paenibacillus polymyxa]|uniref:tail fiber protein n=1 Tax=Paenibacillus polymyxa TaxID=1406 RepID=UPI003D2A922C